MNYLITLFSLVFGFSSIDASTFDEAIHQNSTFKVKPSKSNLQDYHHATTLVISCVDFRLRDETERLFREQLHLLDDYDELSLPGASLAFTSSQHEKWGETISETIAILKKLHKIKQVIFLDHMGCGAYKLVKGSEAVSLPEKERQEHLASFRAARSKLAKEFPELKVFTLIINLNGVVTKYEE